MLHLKKVLLRFPNWIGDAVMASVIVEELRASYPDLEMEIVAKPHIGALFEAHPQVGKIHPLSKAAAPLIERGDIDATILLTNSFSSAWQAYTQKWPQIIGYRKELRQFMLSKSLPFPKDYQKMHLVDVYRNLLSLLDIKSKGSAPSLFLSEEEKANKEEKLFRLGINPKKPCIVISPGAAYGLAKCWLPERFRDLILKAYKQFPGADIALIGDASMHTLNENLITKAPRVLNLAGKTSIRELMLLLSHARVLVTNDSGPMHIASALGKPVLALFGSTSSERTGPYQKGVVLQSKISCSPCYLRTCPIDFRCMKALEVDKVFDLMKKMGAPWT